MAGNQGVLRSTYVYTLDGKTYTNQVHFIQEQGDLAATTLTDHGAQHGAAIRSLWADNLAPLLTSSASLREVGLQYLSETHRFPDIPPALPGTPQVIDFLVGEESVYTTDLPLAGSVSGDFLPAFNSFRARKITAKPGRRGRGHNSFAGVPESEAAGNVLTSGDWTTWQLDAPAMLGSGYSFTVAGTLYRMIPVVLSVTQARYAGIVPQVAWVYAYPITSVIPNRLIGTMRRRKKKVL